MSKREATDIPAFGAVEAGASRIARWSGGLARVEAAAGAILVGAICLLMVASAVARKAQMPLIWADEMAVHLMVCLAFIGASLGLARRNHMVIGLLPDSLSPRMARALALVTDLLILVFLLVMAVVIWNWLDPVGLWRAGSGAALAAETFNFVYTDPTQTLGLRKIWFWLILPLSTLCGLVHALALLAQDWTGWRALS